MLIDSLITFLTSTAFIDAIIVFLVLETTAVCALRFRAQRSDPLSPIAGSVAGLCLLLALRAILAGSAPVWMILALSGAFIAHLLDIRTHIPHDLTSAVQQSKGTP